MNNDKKGPVPIFKAPENLRERATWLRHWVNTIFNVYGSVIEQAIRTMPDKNIGQMKEEIEMAKIELMNLIKPEKWESEDEPGKDKI